MCPYVMVVALSGLLAGVGAVAILSAVQVWRERRVLQPRTLLRRCVLIALASAVLTGLSLAQYVEAPTLHNLLDLLLGLSMVVATLWGAHRLQTQLAIDTALASAERQRR